MPANILKALILIFQKELVYSGNKLLQEVIKIGDEDVAIGKLLLSPTRTYLPILKPLFQKYRQEIHGIIHCTGGAQTKVKKFLSDDLMILKDNLFPIPPIFQMIHDLSGTPWKEMYQVFNMGHRLEIYMKPDFVEGVIALSKSFGVDAQIIGQVKPKQRSASVIVDTSKGTFEY